MPSRHPQLPLHSGLKECIMVCSVLRSGAIQIAVSRSMRSLQHSWGNAWHCRGRHDAQQALGHGCLFLWICPLLIGLCDAPWCVGVFLATFGTLMSDYDEGWYLHASHSYQHLAINLSYTHINFWMGMCSIWICILILYWCDTNTELIQLRSLELVCMHCTHPHLHFSVSSGYGTSDGTGPTYWGSASVGGHLHRRLSRGTALASGANQASGGQGMSLHLKLYGGQGMAWASNCVLCVHAYMQTVYKVYRYMYVPYSSKYVKKHITIFLRNHDTCRNILYCMKHDM